MEDQLLNTAGSVLNYGPYQIIINMVAGLVFGLIIASIYRLTHKGISYSQSFTLTLVFVTLIVSIVMMVIGSSLARAFALVGALSIIRFRTVVKDTKDTAFVFAGLAMGMAAGTGSYFLAIAGTTFFCCAAFALYKINYGALYKSEFILRFVFDQNFSSSAYLETIQEFAKRSNMLHIEPSGDGKYLKLTYDINLKEGATADRLATVMGQAQGLSEVTLISSKSDVDY